MSNAIAWLAGKKTYLLVLAYVILQIINGGGLEALGNTEGLESIVLGAAVAALRAGVAKVGKPA